MSNARRPSSHIKDSSTLLERLGEKAGSSHAAASGYFARHRKGGDGQRNDSKENTREGARREALH